MTDFRAFLRSIGPWRRLAAFAFLVLLSGVLLRLASWLGAILLIISLVTGIWAIFGAFTQGKGQANTGRRVLRGVAILAAAPMIFVILAPLGTSLGEVVKPLSTSEKADRQALEAQREAEERKQAEAAAAAAKAEAATASQEPTTQGDTSASPPAPIPDPDADTGASDGAAQEALARFVSGSSSFPGLEMQFRCRPSENVICLGVGLGQSMSEFDTESAEVWLDHYTRNPSYILTDNFKESFAENDLDLGKLLTWDEFVQEFWSSYADGYSGPLYTDYVALAEKEGFEPLSQAEVMAAFRAEYDLWVNEYVEKHGKKIRAADKWILKVRGKARPESCTVALRKPAEFVGECGWQWAYIVQHDESTGEGRMLARVSNSYENARSGTLVVIEIDESTCEFCYIAPEDSIQKYLLQAGLAPTTYTTVLGNAKKVPTLVAKKELPFG